MNKQPSTDISQIIVRQIRQIKYIDSNMIHEQTDEIAKPVINIAVGFVIEETKDHVTIAAELVGKEYRRQLSIPKVAIIK